MSLLNTRTILIRVEDGGLNYKLVVLNEKGNAQVGDLISEGSPKEGRFCKAKRLVVVYGDGSH